MASESLFSLSAAERAQICAEFRQVLHADIDATLDRLRDARGTVVLNSDDLFNTLPRYAANVEERKFLGPLLYEVAKEFTDLVYARLLARPLGENDTVVFTAGGSATGKSTILRTEGQRPGVDFIVDTTFSNAERALSQVDQALSSGRRVRVFYVYRDFIESLRGMLERAADPLIGRVVPVDDMARTHHGVQQAVLAALERYEDEPRVEIIRLINLGVGRLSPLNDQEFFGLLYPSVDSLQERGQTFLDALREDQRSGWSGEDQHHDPGGQDFQLSGPLYEAARSQIRARGPSPG